MNLKAWLRLGWMLAVAGGVGCGGQDGLEPQEAGGLRVVREQALGEGFGSRGQDFWLAFPSNLDTSVTLTVFITGETATTGTVRVPGQGFTANFAVTPGQVTSVVVPVTTMLATYQTAENKGVQVTAAADVTVYGLNRRTASTDAFLGLPVSSLGTEYMALAYPTTASGRGSQLSVVATQNATRVTITPSVVPTGGQAAGVPFSVTLNQGQTYQLTSNTAGADLSGSLITADKAVAVYGGHKCANIPNSGTGACDFLVEQLPPLSAWGKSFVTVPLATRLNGDTFRFVASANATQVSVNGTVVATLNRGQVHQRIISGSAVITSTQPILVAQYSNGTNFDGVLSDPFMMLIPPYEQFLTEYTMTTPASGFRVNYLNVVVPTAGIGTVLLDGAPILATNFKPIGTSGFSGAQMPMTLGSHRLSSPLPIGAFMYGFDQADSYGYPGGMSLAPVASVASVTLAPKSASPMVNTEHCVTATVSTSLGVPLAGVRVDLAVTGAHTLARSANSDAAGKVAWCYTGTNGGTDTLKASVGLLSDSATAAWRVNRPPVVSAGADLAGYIGQVLNLNGSASDADGDSLSVAWSFSRGEGVESWATCTFGAVNSAATTVRCDDDGVYLLHLTVSDGVNAPVTATVKLTVLASSKVTACNLPRYTKNPSVNLCGYVTPGSDGSPITAYWFTVDGGEPIHVAPTPTNVSSGFVSSLQTLAEGEHVIRLYAESAQGNVTVRQKTVTVDTTAPALQVLSPTAQDVLAGKTFTVTSAVADAIPVTVTTQFVQKSEVPSGTGVVAHPVTVGSTGYSTVLVQARDAAGNVSEVRVRVYVAP